MMRCELNAAATATTKTPAVRLLKQTGQVGFDTLPDQVVNRSVKDGFVFNIMCIGETGMGKSTLMNSLFNTSFESKPSSHTLQQVQLKAHTYELQESNVALKLTICDTVGFGDQINKEDSFKSVMDYVDVQFEKYLQEELNTKRSLVDFHDSRIHACLYFICPTGHGLKSLDLLCMKQLDSKVNIIPIIAKADAISKAELKIFKEKIREELKSSKINIYQFPTDDETVAGINTAMNAHTPFAVVGSSELVRIGAKRVRARQYPWGIVQVQNEMHCDFVKLREMLIRTNMADLCERTHLKHYELYRQKRLQEMGFSDVDNENGAISFHKNIQVKRSHHLNELSTKEEAARQNFVQRVREKEAELKENERELYLRFDKLKKECAEELRKVEEARQKLANEYGEFTLYKNHYVALHNTMTLGKSRKK